MTSAADIFKKMPERFQPDKAAGMNATIQFDLSGEDGGQWHVTIAEGTLKVEKGTVENPNATLHMSASDFIALSAGELNAMTAFMSGKIKSDGDLSTVMQFQSVVGL